MVDAPVLSVSSGAVRGVRVGESDRYLGIPSAAPPFGTRRFRPPEPAPHIDDAPRAEELAGLPSR